MATASEIAQCQEWFDQQLRSTVGFWTKHSIDQKHGGYYNCLGKNGEIYDTTKYGWLQGRQVWMLAKLYNVEPHYHSPDVLQAAVNGGEFLLESIKVKGEQRCYFAVSEAGLPVRIQRKPYTECFFIVGLIELFRATGNQKYQVAAEEMLQQLIYWICFDDTGLGLLRLPGAPASRELGRPMMLLNVVSEFCGSDANLREKYMEQLLWSTQAILEHHDGKWVHEHVLFDGGYPLGSQGRLSNPGHAFEAGWFLLQEAHSRGDMALQQTAIKQFIELPWEYGMDKECGGLYYFLDSSGISPAQLEWSMKLWWVHCEALVATLMAYTTTHDPTHWAMFKQILDYTVAHFPDSEDGEWYGYLTREGRVNQSFKGGQYKGFFHVPRCLLLCKQLLGRLQVKQSQE